MSKIVVIVIRNNNSLCFIACSFCHCRCCCVWKMIMKVQMNRVTKRRETKTDDSSGTMAVSSVLMCILYGCVWQKSIWAWLLNSVCSILFLAQHSIAELKIQVYDEDISQPSKVSVLGHDVEVVDSFVYLGSCIDIAGGSETDICRRIEMTRTCMKALDRNIWCSSISLHTNCFT